MKFQRIGKLTRIVTLSSMLCMAAASYAVDEDLPPPTGEPAIPSTDTPAPIEDESLPAPSLGDEALPEPSADRGQENAKNQVNRPAEDDEIFLPTPNVNDNIYQAPVGNPAPRFSSEDADWRVLTRNRPIFSMHAGIANKSYINSEVKGRITGPSAGFSIRALSLGQTVFLHAYAGYSWFNVGDVISVSGVKDGQLQYGGILEFGVGRRFSLYGSLLRRQSQVSTEGASATSSAERNVDDLENVGDPGTFYLGAGAQWDFYVIPHGSLGLRAHMETDLFMLTLSMAMEPQPRKRLNLNFDRTQQ